MQKQTISLVPFEIDIKPTKYVLTATADVWYDLVGVYHIFCKRSNEILHSILIKDNSKPFEEVARFCFEYLMPSKDFILLEQYSDYESLYKTINMQPIQMIGASKFLFDNIEEEIAASLLQYEPLEKIDKIDISDERLKITNIINDIPLYLTKWSGGWAHDEIYIYDYRKKKFTYHFFDYSPYETDNDEITDLRQKIAQNFSDHHKYMMLAPINEYQHLFEYNNGSFKSIDL